MLKTLFSHTKLITHSNILFIKSNFFCRNNKYQNEAHFKTNQQNINEIQAKEMNKKKQQMSDQKTKKQIQKEQIGPKFFSQIDFRIGEITECWKHPQSQNLYCEKINLHREVRQIASGLQKYIPQQRMKGKVLVMSNLKPRTLAGFISNGMVMCVSSQDKSILQLVVPQGSIGQRIYLQNFQDLFKQVESLPVLNPKKKVLEKSLQHLKTNQYGFVIWKGFKLMTKTGPIKTNIKNGKVS